MSYRGRDQETRRQGEADGLLVFGSRADSFENEAFQPRGRGIESLGTLAAHVVGEDGQTVALQPIKAALDGAVKEFAVDFAARKAAAA